jgi:salicylate hydroxylase
MRIGIVGAGIGGLSTAAFLVRAGHEVTVFEQASALGEIGAGIQLSPNATRLLARLGVGPALDAVAVRPEAIEQRRWADGTVLSRVELGDVVERAFGAPYLHVHRADLVEVLGTAVPAACVRTARRVTGVDPDGTVVLADATQERFDAVIGADGIHSVVRRALVGDGPATFSGHVAYRALVPGDAVRALGWPALATAWLGPGAHVVHYYLRAGALHNIVAIHEDPTWTTESWTTPGDPEVLRAAFAGWAPAVRDLLALVERTHRWALHDRAPLPVWSRGHVTLLGDACHPMLPYVAQGGAQAVEDAAALAAALDGVAPDAVPGALVRYESTRRERTTAVQTSARANATTFHLPDGEAQERRDAAMARAADPDPRASRVAWLYAHDAAVLPAV